MAARQALEFAIEIGVDRVILEGDSEFLINALRVAAVPLHNLVILRMMWSTLPPFSQLFNSHVRRHCNSHSLARRVVFSPYLLVWMEDYAPRN